MKTKRILVLTLILTLLFQLSAMNVLAAKVDCKSIFQYGVSKQSVTKMKSVAKKLTGVKQKKNSKYPTIYYSGKKVKMGMNLKAVYGTKKDTYTYISNTGNKQLTIYSVAIGDSKKAVASKMNKVTRSHYNNIYMFGNAARVVFKYKNGKVSSYTYTCAPTSR